MIREYPDVRQTRDYDCGHAAIDGVFRYLGLGIRTCAAVLSLATESDGLHPSTVEAILRRASMRLQSGTMTVEDLKHHTKLERPVLCPVSLLGGHWVTVLGVERGKVRYHCPTDGFGHLPIETFVSSWRDSTRAGHCFDTWGIAVL